jgi:metal-responsive CopG/Arc/MetJ family transcriptional regulator
MEPTKTYKTPKNKVISTRFPEDLLQEVRAYARKKRWSLSQAISILVEQKLQEDKDESLA